MGDDSSDTGTADSSNLPQLVESPEGDDVVGRSFVVKLYNDLLHVRTVDAHVEVWAQGQRVAQSDAANFEAAITIPDSVPEFTQLTIRFPTKGSDLNVFLWSQQTSVLLGDRFRATLLGADTPAFSLHISGATGVSQGTYHRKTESCTGFGVSYDVNNQGVAGGYTTIKGDPTLVSSYVLGDRKYFELDQKLGDVNSIVANHYRVSLYDCGGNYTEYCYTVPSDCGSRGCAVNQVTCLAR
jgi:hypothetical protein